MLCYFVLTPGQGTCFLATKDEIENEHRTPAILCRNASKPCGGVCARDLDVCIVDELGVTIQDPKAHAERDPGQYYCPGINAYYWPSQYQCNSNGITYGLCSLDAPSNCGVACYNPKVQACVLANGAVSVAPIGITSSPQTTIQQLQNIYTPLSLTGPIGGPSAASTVTTTVPSNVPTTVTSVSYQTVA